MSRRTEVVPPPSLPLRPYPATTCEACGKGHKQEPYCRAMKEGLWAIIKSKYKGDAYRWARGALGFTERPRSPEESHD